MIPLRRVFVGVGNGVGVVEVRGLKQVCDVYATVYATAYVIEFALQWHLSWADVQQAYAEGAI